MTRLEAATRLVNLPKCKEKLCLTFSRTGACQFGSRCLHAHGEAELVSHAADDDAPATASSRRSARRSAVTSSAGATAGIVHPRFYVALASARRARDSDEPGSDERALWRYEEAVGLLEPAAAAGLLKEHL